MKTLPQRKLSVHATEAASLSVVADRDVYSPFDDPDATAFEFDMEGKGGLMSDVEWLEFQAGAFDGLGTDRAKLVAQTIRLIVANMTSSGIWLADVLAARQADEERRRDEWENGQEHASLIHAYEPTGYPARDHVPSPF